MNLVAMVLFFSGVVVQISSHSIEDESDLKQLLGRLNPEELAQLEKLMMVEERPDEISDSEEEFIGYWKHDAFPDEGLFSELDSDHEDFKEIMMNPNHNMNLHSMQKETVKARIENEAIMEVMKGMDNEDLDALIQNIEEKLQVDDKLLEKKMAKKIQYGDPKVTTKEKPNQQAKIIPSRRKRQDLSFISDEDMKVMQGMDDEDLDALIQTFEEKFKNGIKEEMLHVEKVFDKMGDKEMEVALKNIEDQQIGEMISGMDDTDFDGVIQNLDEEIYKEIKMARGIIKKIDSDELKESTKEKLNQHAQMISSRRKRRDLADISEENEFEMKSQRETQKEDDDLKFPASLDFLSTIKAQQELVAAVVDKEKEARRRRKREPEVVYKEPTYYAHDFEPVEKTEEEKKSSEHLNRLSQFEYNSRKRRGFMYSKRGFTGEYDNVKKERERRGFTGEYNNVKKERKRRGFMYSKRGFTGEYDNVKKERKKRSFNLDWLLSPLFGDEDYEDTSEYHDPMPYWPVKYASSNSAPFYNFREASSEPTSYPRKS